MLNNGQTFDFKLYAEFKFGIVTFDIRFQLALGRPRHIPWDQRLTDHQIATPRLCLNISTPTSQRPKTF